MEFFVVFFSLCILFIPALRHKILNARNRIVSREVCKVVSRKVDLGDWWIIYMLGRNLDPIIYKDVMGELAKKIEKREK